MATIVTRAGKGTPLTNTELDNNFTNLNTDKLEAATTATLTNKTINLTSNTLVATSAQILAAITDETGTGSLVFNTSPTFVTPILGTPTSGNFSTGTFTWPTFNQNTTGTAAGLSATLATNRGGTNLTSFTSGGVVYASSSSALATGSALTFDGTSAFALRSNNASNFAYFDVGRTTAEARIATASATNDFLTGTAAGDALFYKVTVGNAWYGTASTGAAIFTINNGEQMRLTSSSLYTASGINVGIGISSLFPSTPHVYAPQVRVGLTGNYFSQSNAGLGLSGTSFIDNAYVKSSIGDFAYLTSAKASRILARAGEIIFSRSSGTDTADAAVNFTTSAVIDSAGNLGVYNNANFGNSGSSNYGGYATGGRVFSLAAAGGTVPAISASTDTTASSTAFRAYTKEVANDTSYAYEIQTGNGTGVTTQKLQLTWGANGLWNSTGLAVTGAISATTNITLGNSASQAKITMLGGSSAINQYDLLSDTSGRLYINNAYYGTIAYFSGAAGLAVTGAISATGNISVQDNLSVVLGTSGGAVSISHITPGVPRLAFTAGGSEKMALTDGGYFGVGTTNPQARLEIGGTNPTMNIGPASVTSGAYLSYNTSGNYFSINAVTQGVAYRNIGIATDGGNVGVGLVNPAWRLMVKGLSSGTVGVFAYDGTFGGTNEANIGLRFYNGGSASDIPQIQLAGYGTTNYTGNFAVRVMQGGTYPNTMVERFTVQGNTGNVGIGATSPSTNLTIGGTAASGGAGGGLGVFLSRGAATNFFEAFDGTKSFIGGVDNTLGYAKVGTLTTHDLAIITGNGAKIYINSTNAGVTIGSITAAPGSGLRVEGAVNTVSGIVGTNQIIGFVSSNYTGTRYWLLHDMTNNPFQAFNCQGGLLAASYSVWNNSNIFIRRTYSSFSATASITGIAKSGVDVSIVDITYSSVRYLAIKFAGGDPGIEANLIGYLLDQQFVSGVAQFINGTSGVTENAVLASY